MAATDEPPEPARRRDALLAELRNEHGRFLPLGTVRTRPARRTFLRSGFAGQWELYDSSSEGEGEGEGEGEPGLRLGPAPDSLGVFGPDGALDERVRAEPMLHTVAIPEPHRSRIARLDSELGELVRALESESIAVVLPWVNSRLVRLHGAPWRVDGTEGPFAALHRIARDHEARLLWMTAFESREHQREDTGSVLAAMREAMTETELRARVLGGEASIGLAGDEERWLYRRADGTLVVWAPTGEWIEGYYPGAPGYADPVDAPKYAERPCAGDELGRALSSPSGFTSVLFGIPEARRQGARYWDEPLR